MPSARRATRALSTLQLPAGCSGSIASGPRAPPPTPLARRHRARVIAPGLRPRVGRQPWALQRGLEAARHDIVLSLEPKRGRDPVCSPPPLRPSSTATPTPVDRRLVSGQCTVVRREQYQPLSTTWR
jgi:hypothetical protein